MLQNFIICINSVIPQAVYLIVGIMLKHFKVISEKEVKRFTSVVFVMLYPFLMFDNLYGKNLDEHFSLPLIIYACVSLVIIIVCVWWTVCHFEKDNYNRGAMIQAMFRSNIVLMGLPVATYIFGKGNVASVAVLLMVVVPIYNVIAVVIFEDFRGGKVSWKSILHGVLTNPLIDGGIAAIIVLIFGIKMPDVLMVPIQALSDSTTPVAMVLLGASLKISGIKQDKKKVLSCVAVKLLVVPLFGIGGAVLFGLRGVDLLAITLMYATPTALASFAMASSMGGNGELTGEAVVFSTIMSCVTLPIILFILMQLGYLVA